MNKIVKLVVGDLFVHTKHGILYKITGFCRVRMPDNWYRGVKHHKVKPTGKDGDDQEFVRSEPDFLNSFHQE